MKKRILIAVLAAVALLAPMLAAPTVARAESDDGGLRSVFALGAGNRALALGGAYAAVADDASAGIWNPAGLAALDRRRFEATRTSLFGMGFAEQYFAAALPHWKWGNTSLIIRHFGVDGIEERDDRNVLLDDDLQDSETEILLTHARTLRPGLDVGAGVKIQRHSLAGYSGGGYGLDLGVLATPLMLTGRDGPGAEAWTVGLAVRNFLEPAVRLDLESVPDPRALRFGTAWRRPLSPDLNGLVAMDLEKTAGMDSRLHLGAEVAYRDLGALRLGVLAGSFTAGFGVSWRDVVVDFAFENHRFGAVKRLGVSLFQGPSTREMRRLRDEREEAERARRLQDAFAASEHERRTQLLDAARAAMDDGDYETATDRVALVKILDPGNAEAAALDIEILRAQAARQEADGDLSSAILTLGRLISLSPEDARAAGELRRVRSLSDERAERSREIQILYTRGLDAFASDDLDEARRLFIQAVSVDSTDADVLSMLDRVETAKGQRLAALIDEVRSFGRAGLVAEAEDALTRVRAMGADTDTLAALRNTVAAVRRQNEYEAERERIEREREAQIAALTRNAEEPVPVVDSVHETAAISASRRRELDKLDDRARAMYESGNVDEAVRVWELIWSEDPDDSAIRDALRQEYLSRGMESFSAGRLEEAVESWEHALRVDPEDRRTRSYLDRGRQQLARIRSLQEQDGAARQ